jgi:hypothetical protein
MVGGIANEHRERARVPTTRLLGVKIAEPMVNDPRCFVVRAVRQEEFRFVQGGSLLLPQRI